MVQVLAQNALKWNDHVNKKHVVEEFYTIRIPNLIYASESGHKCQRNNQKKPVYNRNVYLSHELSRCVNDFEARKTT